MRAPNWEWFILSKAIWEERFFIFSLQSLIFKRWRSSWGEELSRQKTETFPHCLNPRWLISLNLLQVSAEWSPWPAIECISLACIAGRHHSLIRDCVRKDTFVWRASEHAPFILALLGTDTTVGSPHTATQCGSPCKSRTLYQTAVVWGAVWTGLPSRSGKTPSCRDRLADSVERNLGLQKKK